MPWKDGGFFFPALKNKLSHCILPFLCVCMLIGLSMFIYTHVLVWEIGLLRDNGKNHNNNILLSIYNVPGICMTR